MHPVKLFQADQPRRIQILASWGAVMCVGLTAGYFAFRPPDAASHGIVSAELRQAMLELERYSTEADEWHSYTSSEARESIKRVREAAEGLTRAASLIPQAAKQLRLPEEQREEFERLAKELHSQAGELVTQTKRGDARGAKVSMDRIRTNCNACHAQFRVSPEVPATSD